MNIYTLQEKDHTRAKSVLARALKNVGGASALTRRLNEHDIQITRQAVSLWTRVPLKYVRTVSRITGIPAKEFLPEVN